MAVRDQVAPLDCVVRGRGTFPSRGLSTLDLNYKRISRESSRRGLLLASRKLANSKIFRNEL